MSTIISVSNLKKSYKDNEVLKGISFDVKQGGIFALLGSNGAGKTTTINILATLQKADGGEASICGYDCFSQQRDVKKSISLTGQYATVDGSLTGRENLKLIGRLKHIKNPQEKARELLEKFNLTDAADKPASTYSGGMRRRLDIAMSLIGDPKIIFLDEPTTGLDPQSRIAMWELVKEMSSQGITIFLTTQYLEEVEHLADDIAILHEGKIVAHGTSDELKEMLPQGMLKITFPCLDSFLKAKSQLDRYSIANEDEKEYSISILTSGKVDEITNILLGFKSNNIELKNFEQLKPTLEDVFLTIIGYEKDGGK